MANWGRVRMACDAAKVPATTLVHPCPYQPDRLGRIANYSSAARWYTPATRTITASRSSEARAAAQSGASGSESMSAQKTYSQRTPRLGRDSRRERLILRSAKQPRQRWRLPGTFRTAQTRVVFMGPASMGGANQPSGIGSRATTANLVRLASPVWMSAARTSSPYNGATRADATAAAPTSPLSAIDLAAPAVL